MPLATGQVIKERYRIDALLGQGGFGAVYRAWDMTFELTCAIKENLEPSPEAQRQFLREARLLRTLRHPNLPQVTDYFTIEGQGQYLVMDYVDGDDLQHKLEQAGGSLPEKLVMPWIEQICQALSYLHGQNPQVIHRDVKPANIRITPEGKAMLVDFGIAKLFDPNARTTLGARAVTSGYAPPEQYGRGMTDAQSDIYALGATIYHLLTGKMPPDSMDIVSGNTAPLKPAHMVNPGISKRVSAAMQKAMQPNRAMRWLKVDDFTEAIRDQEEANSKNTAKVEEASPDPAPLEQAVGDLKVASPYQTTPIKKPAKTRVIPSRWIAISGVALVILILAVGAIVLRGVLRGKHTDTQTAQAQIGMTETVQDELQLTSDARKLLTQTEYARDIRTQTAEIESRQTQQTLETMTQVAALRSTQTAGANGPIADSKGVKMAYIPAGEFLMGSQDTDIYASSDEKPQHTVYIDAFYIDVYEVSNGLYERCVKDGACIPPANVDSNTRSNYYGFKEFENYPVIYVDWNQARVLCEWRGARLPYEAEWEKAARGGLEGKLYPWGDDEPDCDRANYWAGDKGCVGDTSEVGSYAPNGYGLYDMAGNVWEWVWDWYLGTFFESSPFENPSGPASGANRILRGGSWVYVSTGMRVMFRAGFDPNDRVISWGFRCVR